MTDGYAPTGLPSKCNLCQNSNNPCVNLENDHRRVLKVADITRVPSWNIRQILACVCSRCLLFIESLTESSNLLRLRCTNALNNQNATQIKPMSSYSPELRLTLTPSPDIGVSNVILPSQTATTAVVGTEPCHTEAAVEGSVIESNIRSPSPQGDVLSLLEVHHESSVSPLATESGGAYNKTSGNWPYRVPTAERVCSCCNRSFKQKMEYMKHYRRCLAAKMHYCRSIGAARRKSVYQDDVASIASESSKYSRLIEMQINPLCFRCPTCPATFNLMADLKDHTLVHLKQLSCDICGHISTTQYQFDFHQAECVPKLEVRRENENTARKQQLLPARRKTRLYSQYVTAFAEEQSKDSAIDKTHGKSIKKDCVKTSKKKITVAKLHLPTGRMTRSYSRYVTAAVDEESKDSAVDKTHGKSNKKDCVKTSKTKIKRSYSQYVTASADEQSTDSMLDKTHSQSNKQDCLKLSAIKITVPKPHLPTSRMTRSYSKYLAAAAENTSKESTQDVTNGQSTRKESLKTAKSKGAKSVAKQLLPAERITLSNSLYPTAATKNTPSNSAKVMTNGQSTAICSEMHRSLTPSADIGANNVVLSSQTATTAVVATEPCHTKDLGQGIGTRSSKITPSPKGDVLSLLEDHTFAHRKQFNCDICGHSSTTQYQFDFHRAECVPKFEVIKEKENTAGIPKLPARRKTRSYSVYISAAAEEQANASAIDKTHGQSSKRDFLQTSETKITSAKQQITARRMTLPYSRYLTAPTVYTPRHSAKLMTNGQSTEEECLKTPKPKMAKTVAKSDSNRTSAKVDDSRLSETQPTPAPLQHCSMCPVTFQTKIQLRGHMRLHLKLFHCDICRHKYRTQQQLDEHRTKCIKRMNKNAAYQQQLPPPRMTRLYSKTFSDIEFISNAKNKSEVTAGQQDDQYAEDDDEDDCVSVVDSIYLRRLSYTNRWLDTLNNPESYSRLSQCNETCINESFNEDIPYLFKDLNLLDRLRKEVMLKRITCYEPKCIHITTNLNEMMWHDYICHFKNSWFLCRKCGDCFTSKIFLDYHLDIQDKGHNYVCHKCGVYLPRRHELHSHILQHAKQSADEVEKLTCYWCNLVFLDQHSLWKHCAATGHNWRKKRQLIRIEYSKTNRNMVPLRDAITYTKENIEMHTVPLTRQHSIARKRRIGTVEFKDPSIANCVGMFKGH